MSTSCGNDLVKGDLTEVRYKSSAMGLNTTVIKNTKPGRKNTTGLCKKVIDPCLHNLLYHIGYHVRLT